MPDRKDVNIPSKKPTKREMRKKEREATAAKEREGAKEESEKREEKPCMDENNNNHEGINKCDESSKHSKTNGVRKNNDSHSKEDDVSKEEIFSCDLCNETFYTLMEKNLHKKVCFPQSDFLSSGMEDIIDSEFRKTGDKISPAFVCEFCGQKFTNMVWHTKHLKSCRFKQDKE